MSLTAWSISRFPNSQDKKSRLLSITLTSLWPDTLLPFPYCPVIFYSTTIPNFKKFLKHFYVSIVLVHLHTILFSTFFNKITVVHPSKLTNASSLPVAFFRPPYCAKCLCFFELPYPLSIPLTFYQMRLKSFIYMFLTCICEQPAHFIHLYP